MPTAADRLHLLYEVSRRLTSLDDLDELMRYSTQRTRELFDADGCALLFLDRERGELYFPVASQSAAQRVAEERLTEVRVPRDRGIAGWVLARDEAVRVDDVASDPRFYSGVDQATKMTTRSVLCAPLRSPSGNIGVIEVVNPAPGALTQEDVEFLEALAADIAVAHERALLYARLRGEVTNLRQACRRVGAGLALVGLVVGAGGIVGHLAWALPLAELPGRPGVLGGGMAVAVGVFLLAIGRGWIIPRSTHAT